jgi:hypothetical protein
MPMNNFFVSQFAENIKVNSLKFIQDYIWNLP